MAGNIDETSEAIGVLRGEILSIKDSIVFLRSTQHQINNAVNSLPLVISKLESIEERLKHGQQTMQEIEERAGAHEKRTDELEKKFEVFLGKVSQSRWLLTLIATGLISLVGVVAWFVDHWHKIKSAL